MMPRYFPHVYYGWLVMAIGCLTMMLVMGTFFSSGILFAAITAEYGWSRVATSLPFSVSLVCYAATAWLAGQLFDRYGPRRLFPVGVLCLGLGLITSTWAATPWQLCLSWGVLVAQGFNLAGYAPHLALVALWFNRRRGIASGVMLGGASLGSLLVVPSVQYLVDRYGWRLAYTVLGVVIIASLAPLNALWQRHRPADLGLCPDGSAVPAAPQAPAGPPPLATLWTLRRAMGTVHFWWLFVMVGCLGWVSNLTSVHQIAHLTGNGVSGLLAASIVGMMGLPRAVSSPVWGSLSDRFGREAICALGTLCCILGLWCLALLHPPPLVWLLYGYGLAYGIGHGAFGATEAAAVADRFYGPYLGAIFGALEIGWGIGGFAGAWVGGYWYDRWGSYHGAFMLAIGICCLGCLALWCAAPRHARVLPNRVSTGVPSP
jgi:MFS family permease